MWKLTHIVVSSVAKLKDGAVIAFSDGRHAFYSSELLLTMFAEAEEYRDDDEGSEPG